MGDDIKCLICGEPWETYYINHDMTVSERNRLLSGKGCPSCKGVKPDGRTENDRFADMGHNILTSEDPDAILDRLGL